MGLSVSLCCFFPVSSFSLALLLAAETALAETALPCRLPAGVSLYDKH